MPMPKLIVPEVTDCMIDEACEAAAGRIARVEVQLILKAALATIPPGLHAFLDTAAGEGLVLDGIDAAALYEEIFPERYAAGCRFLPSEQEDQR